MTVKCAISGALTATTFMHTPLLDISFMKILTSEVFHAPELVLEREISVAASAWRMDSATMDA